LQYIKAIHSYKDLDTYVVNKYDENGKNYLLLDEIQNLSKDVAFDKFM